MAESAPLEFFSMGLLSTGWTSNLWLRKLGLGPAEC
jgi:hypothetical protein